MYFVLCPARVFASPVHVTNLIIESFPLNFFRLTFFSRILWSISMSLYYRTFRLNTVYKEEKNFSYPSLIIIERDNVYF